MRYLFKFGRENPFYEYSIWVTLRIKSRVGAAIG